LFSSFPEKSMGGKKLKNRSFFPVLRAIAPKGRKDATQM